MATTTFTTMLGLPNGQRGHLQAGIDHSSTRVHLVCRRTGLKFDDVVASLLAILGAYAALICLYFGKDSSSGYITLTRFHFEEKSSGGYTLQVVAAVLSVLVAMASELAIHPLRQLIVWLARARDYKYAGLLWLVYRVSQATIDGVASTGAASTEAKTGTGEGPGFEVWPGDADYLVIETAAAPGWYEVSLARDLSKQRMVKAFELSDEVAAVRLAVLSFCDELSPQ